MIAHIDMDAFFASCEELRNPELEGKPLVVCVYTRNGSSGAVSTCNYRAREQGIDSGMPVSKARSRSSDETVFLPVDHDYYREKSEEVMSVVRSFSNEIEKTSVDEAYFRLEGDVEEKARKIRSRIETLGLTASIGLAPNKFLAKLCSEEDKPDGLEILRKEEVESFLEGRQVEDIHGVGGKTAEKLSSIGIETVEDVRQANNTVLVENLGRKKAASLGRKSMGKGSTELESSNRKQMSKIVTMEKNSSNPEYIKRELSRAVSLLHGRLETESTAFGKVGIVMIDTDLETYTRSRTIKTSESRKELFQKAAQLLEGFLERNNVAVRRIGVRVSDLVDRDKQASLTNF